MSGDEPEFFLLNERDARRAGRTKAPRQALITPKRNAVLQALKSTPELTLDEAVKLIGGNIYANRNFHVGNTLALMVKANLLRRVKRGVYALPEHE